MLFYWETTKICEVENNLSICIMLSGKFEANSSRDGANTLYNFKKINKTHATAREKKWRYILWDVKEIQLISTGCC